MPSADVGCWPSNQPVACVLQLLTGGHEVAIFEPALPWKRNQPGPSEMSFFGQPAKFLVRYESFLSAFVRDVKFLHPKK